MRPREHSGGQAKQGFDAAKAHSESVRGPIVPRRWLSPPELGPFAGGLLIPTALAALAFEHADGLAAPRIQHLVDQSWLRIAVGTPAIFARPDTVNLSGLAAAALLNYLRSNNAR